MAKENKPQLAVVKKETEAEQNERIKRIKRDIEAEHRERDKYSLPASGLDDVLGELLNAIDRYFVESAWNFKEPLDGGAGKWSGPLMDQLVNKLDPYAHHLFNKVSDYGLKDDYPNPALPGDPDGDLNAMVFAREEAAYVVGVFMGAKLAGASAEFLARLRANLVL